MSIFPHRSAFRSRFKTCYVLFYYVNMFLMPCATATEDLHLLRGSNENELNHTEQNGFILDKAVLKTTSLSLDTDESLLEDPADSMATPNRAHDLGPVSLELDYDGEECGYDIFKDRPDKGSSMSQLTYDDISNGLCAIGKVQEGFAGIPSGDSPQELMETFKGIVDIASVFVPQMAIVGQALGLISGFLSGNEEPEEDPMITYFDEKFLELDSKLTKILDAIQGIELEICKDTWESDRNEYIEKKDSSYKKFTEDKVPGERVHGREDLLRQCRDFPPYYYSKKWQDIVLENGASFTNCFHATVTDSANRVLYFRKTYSSKILENVYKAARYEGICDGLRKQDDEVSSASGPDSEVGSPSDYDPAVHIKNIYDKIAEEEDKMYNATISEWKSPLQDKYTNAKTDANVVMNALKDDFFPDHRYAAVLITKNDDPEGNYFSVFGTGGEEYGSFSLDTKDKKTVVVFYRKRSSRQSLTDLPRFNNCVCGGEKMCERKNDGQCSQRQDLCRSPWHQVAENSNRNNKHMHDLYASRGTVLIKTVSEKEHCNDPFADQYGHAWCGKGKVFEDDGSRATDVSYAGGNDAIIQSFDTPLEGNQVYDQAFDLSERYQYKLIGIAGDFECSQSRQCSSDDFCDSKCSGTAPTPSVVCDNNGNPICDRNEECKPGFECKESALNARSTSRHTSRSTYLANLLSKGLARTYLHRTDAFVNDDDCESVSVGHQTRSSGTCQQEAESCFSSESKVNVLQEGLVPISEIKIGDLVQSKKDGSFSRVYALEKNHFGLSKFYQLITNSGLILELTDRHMIFLKNSPKPIPAREVKVGDILATDDSSDAVSGEVVEIEAIRRNGYYNPLTEDGTIILNNGVVASSFSVARSSSSNFFDKQTEILHWHTLSHLANAPLRVVCKAWFGFCAEEIFQDENGLHKFVVLLKRASNLPNWAQAIVFPFIFGMGVFFTVLELMYDKAEALLEVASSTGIGVGLLTFSLVAALAVPGLLAFRKRYFL